MKATKKIRTRELFRLQKSSMRIDKHGRPAKTWFTIVVTEDKCVYRLRKGTYEPTQSAFDWTNRWVLEDNLGARTFQAYISFMQDNGWQQVNFKPLNIATEPTFKVPSVPRELPPEDLRLVITGPARLLKKLNKKIRKDGN